MFVVAPEDDFDDLHGESRPGPLLPPEDRLWRHPSELARRVPLDSPEAISARRHWLAATPSRAGAWTAGVVGAVLATGVVLVGVHLTHWLTPAPSASLSVHTSFSTASAPSGATASAPTSTVASTTEAVTPHDVNSPPLGDGATISAVKMDAIAVAIATAMPVIEVTGPEGSSRGVGVVVRSDGFVLVPSALIFGASAIQVVFGDQEFPARVVGSDPATGLAVVHVNSSGLVVAPFSNAASAPAGSFVGFVWLDRTAIYGCLGTVLRVDSTVTGLASPPLLDSVQPCTSMPASPTGTALIDGTGHLVGVEISTGQTPATVAPAWLASIVARDLIANGRVVHGVLGIDGATVAHRAGSVVTQGVEVQSVVPNGPAAKAGLKRGDVIESVNGIPVASMDAMIAQLYGCPPRESVILDVVRNGRLWATDATLAGAA